MRRRVMVGVPPTAPEGEGEKTPKPEERGVVHRRRVPPKEYLRYHTSTAAEQLKAVVGEPPEIIESADAATLRKLEDAYEEYEFDPSNAKESYESAVQSLSGLKADETTIQIFIDRRLPAHKHEEDFQDKAGAFLGTMIQNSSNQKITLDVTKLPTLNWLCCLLEHKEVTIIGDVGDYTAMEAKSGSVTIKGNARNSTGWWLDGASVTVEGNTGDGTAASAKSGSVTVKGNAGEGTGWWVNGASVTVEGNAGDETAFGARSGSITVKGNAGDKTGQMLEGASVIVKGNAGDNTAAGAKSGEISVKGKISGFGGGISETVKVFEARKQIWPKTK